MAISATVNRGVLPYSLYVVTAALSRGVAEVCIYGDAPLRQEPFWDIAPIPIFLAPRMVLQIF